MIFSFASEDKILYDKVPCLMAIVINVLRDMYSGPGGGARHLHGGDLGFDACRMARLLLEVVFRKRIKTSANSTNTVLGRLIMAAAGATALAAALPIRRRDDVAHA
jgi:hypothetical protein